MADREYENAVTATLSTFDPVDAMEVDCCNQRPVKPAGYTHQRHMSLASTQSALQSLHLRPSPYGSHSHANYDQRHDQIHKFCRRIDGTNISVPGGSSASTHRRQSSRRLMTIPSSGTDPFGNPLMNSPSTTTASLTNVEGTEEVYDLLQSAESSDTPLGSQVTSYVHKHNMREPKHPMDFPLPVLSDDNAGCDKPEESNKNDGFCPECYNMSLISVVEKRRIKYRRRKSLNPFSDHPLLELSDDDVGCYNNPVLSEGSNSDGCCPECYKNRILEVRAEKGLLKYLMRNLRNPYLNIPLLMESSDDDDTCFENWNPVTGCLFSF